MHAKVNGCPRRKPVQALAFAGFALALIGVASAQPVEIARPGDPAARAASVACEAHKFVTNEDVLGMVVADLSRLPNSRKKGTRYLTLTHLKNSCIDDLSMKVFRQGAIKLINSLSRASDVVRLETIDPDESILRINIDDLGWDAKDWDEVLAVYPYNLQPESDFKSVLTAATGTQLPYVRADWFASAASQPPLYDKLVKLPEHVSGTGQG